MGSEWFKPGAELLKYIDTIKIEVKLLENYHSVIGLPINR
jgi:hypothetical protein